MVAAPGARWTAVLAAVLGFLTFAAPYPAAAQCDACETPRVMAVVRVVVPEDHPALDRLDRQQGSADARARLGRALQLQLREDFGSDCVQVSTQGDVQWVLGEAALEQLSGVDDRGDVPVDDLGQDEIRQAAGMTGAPYLLTLTVSATASGAHATAALINQETMITYARESSGSSAGVAAASSLTSALSNVADQLDLWETIRRSETPVSAELVAEPDAVDAGDAATLRVDRLLNADGVDVRGLLEDRTRLAVRLKEDDGRWRLTGPPLDGAWRLLGERGRLEARCQSPRECQQDDEHPLEVEVEVAPACWRGPARRNGDAFADGRLRARCQLSVEVLPDESQLEAGDNTGVDVQVSDHRGRAPEGESRVTVQTQRLRHGTAAPGSGTATGSPATFDFEYAVDDDAREGTEILAARAVVSDRWGERAGDGEAAVSIGVGHWWLTIEHRDPELVILAVAEHEGPLEGEWDLTTLRGGLFKTDCGVTEFATDESMLAMTVTPAGAARWAIRGDLSLPDGRMVRLDDARYEITLDWGVLCDGLDWDSDCGTTPVRGTITREKPAGFDALRRTVGAALRADRHEHPVYPSACPPDEGG